MKAKYHMTQTENIFLAKRNIVDYIWKSANLEGIGVTYPDTQAIYNGMSVSGYTIDEINAINDLKHAWQYLFLHLNDLLDLAFIEKIHMLLGKFTIINAGSLRKEEVRIGGTEWVPGLPDKKKAGIEILKITKSGALPLDRALDLMLYLMREQLFYDGNKRVAMLACNKIMIENGQGVISVKQKDIKEFYKLLVEFYETGSKPGLKQFLYNNCIDGMKFNT